MERSEKESKFLAPCALWPVELKLTHIACSPNDTLVHFQGHYLTICELDYNILQVEIQNAVKTNVSVQFGDLCLVEDPKNGRWYRGRVQNQENDLFHVFLLDHGDVLIVKPDHIFELSDMLLMLPPKIVCGFFANMLPVQKRWSSLTEKYFSSLIGSEINGYIHARLPYQVLILEVPDIKSDLLKLKLARHVDTSTFLLLVEMLIQIPIQQSNESVPDLLIDKQKGQEYCLKSSNLSGFEEILSLNGPKLKPGQTADVILTAAVKPGLFYCRLTSMEGDAQKMSHKLALMCESGSGSFSNEELENLGLLCAVKGKDEKWHRGVVQCLPINSHVRVVFVDSGYCESVKVENVLQLPSEFLSTPIMAVPCSLSCLDGQDDDIKKQQLGVLKRALLGGTFEVLIDGFCKDQNFYLVTLSTPQNPKLHVNESQMWYDAEMKKAQMPNTVLREAIQSSLFEGYVVYVQNPKQFWIRTNDQTPKFEEMMKEMTDYFSKVQLNEEIIEDPVPGALCSAMYELDMNYYRALVVDTLENGAEVFFIDFGNTEKVPGMLIKKLPKKFAVQPEYAVNCALAHVAPIQDTWTTASSDFFRQITENKTLLVSVFHRKNGKAIVDLFERGEENEINIANVLAAANMAEYWKYNRASASVNMVRQPEDNGKAKCNKDLVSLPNLDKVKAECAIETTKLKVTDTNTFKAVHFKPGCQVNVICSHVNSPSDFWCQNKSTKTDLDKMMKELQIFYQTYMPVYEPPMVCCAVKSPQDHRWYRACVLEKDNEEVNAILVDSGVVIKEKMSNIRALAPQFFELQEQAFRCRLNLTEPAKGDAWSTEACKIFHDFMSEDSSEIVCQIISQLYEQGNGVFNVVNILKHFQQASAYLVEKDVAVELQTPRQFTSSTCPRSFVYSSFNVRSGSEELAYVTHINSPWELYLQLDRNTEIIEKLMERVTEESQLLPKSSEDCCGNICLARYFGDGKWYRGLTQTVQSHRHVSMFFIDYGNKQISEKCDTKPIPRKAYELLVTPMQALRCSLSDIPEGEHLPEVNAWLESAILNKPIQAKFVTRDSSGHFICDLYDGHVHINEKVRVLIATYGMEECDSSVSEHALEPCIDKVDIGSKETNSKKRTRTRTRTHKGPIKETAQKASPNLAPSHQNMPRLSDLPDTKITPGSRGVGFISHCNSNACFFIQMDDNEPSIIHMCEELNNAAFRESMKHVASEIKVGDLVAAEYTEDMALYRAVVTKVLVSDQLQVEFIDYGNTATIERNNVYMLTTMFLSQPRLSVPCILSNPHSSNDEMFIKNAVDKTLMVKYVQKHENTWKVNIQVLERGQQYDGDQKKDAALQMNLQDKCPTALQNENKNHEDPTTKMNSKESFQQRKTKAATYVQTFEKPKWFLKKSLRRLNKVISKQKSEPSTSATGNAQLKKNISNASKSPTSAKLSQQESKSVKNVELPADNDQLLSPPNVSSEANSSMGHAEKAQTLSHAPVRLNIEYKGFAAAVTTPAEFYVILEDHLLVHETVSAMLENLPEVLMPLPQGHLIPGVSCLVKLAEMKTWRRAELVECGYTSALINLVDCGQYAVLSKQDISALKQLPEDLAWLPKVTYHCLLRGVQPIGQDWSDEAIVLFQNCMCNRNLRVRFRQFVSETQWEVDITTGNQNLAKMLVDSGHAMYIDNMLGIRFQQEMEITEQSCEDERQSMSESTFDQKASQDSDGDQDTTKYQNNSNDEQGPVEEKLAPGGGTKPCALM